MKVKTKDLSGPALNWAAGMLALPFGVKTVGGVIYVATDSGLRSCNRYEPTENATQAMALMEAEGIDVYQVERNSPRGWEAEVRGAHLKFAKGQGRNPRIAITRCYVTLKAGETMEIPDELLQNQKIFA
jgi:hypothetical protein